MTREKHHRAQWSRSSRFRDRFAQKRKNCWRDRSKERGFFKGIAQNAVQLESALSNRKRKASEMEEGDAFTGKTFGIVTDVEKWYFLECLYNEGKLSFKLSESVTVAYKVEDLQTKVEKVIGHIAWLLEEAQMPDSALDVDKEREIKRVRSTGNLAGKGTSTQTN